MTKKTYLIIPLCAAILAAAIGLYLRYSAANIPPQDPSRTIALIPLDSRPCNTQYPQILSQMANYRIILPPTDALDDFLRPADSQALWQWLEQASANCQQIIIFTNELFNGGLIHSRNSQAYDDTAAQLTRLEQFAQAHPQHTITLVTILPRLKPSQFDDALWPYEVQLTLWGQQLDQAALDGAPQPAIPDGVPPNIAQQYLDLFDHSRQLAEGLAQLAQNGTINRLIIGQDDAQALCPANIIYRDLQNLQIPNLTLIHGADEITMLLVANAVNNQPPLGVNIIYTNPALAQTYFPYEAAPLTELINDKLALAGLAPDPDSDWTVIIHTDPQAADNIPSLLNAYSQAAYLGLADIAYTNKGDSTLYPYLSQITIQDQLNCYAGWNTASNTLGTIFAHLRISQQLQTTYPALNKAHRTTALTALHTFKIIRLTEDQIYQAHLSEPLRTNLQNWDIMHYTNTFQPNRRLEAQTILQTRFAPYQTTLNDTFSGTHHITLGQYPITYTITDLQTPIQFPWNRAFEIIAQPTFTLTL